MQRSIERQSIVVRTPGRGEPVRVLLIDESVIALHGLKAVLLRCDWIVVAGTACTEAEAFTAMETCRLDVVVLDVRVGCASGISLCRAIRKSHPNVGVVFFTDKDDLNILYSAIIAGARGYLLKAGSGDALMKGIEAVAIGRAMIDQHLTQQVLCWVRERVRTLPHRTVEDCPDEDLRLLSRVAAGETNKAIALELHVDQSVIARRLQRIYKRLRVSGRAEAASCFMKSGRELFSGPHHAGRYATSSAGY